MIELTYASFQYENSDRGVQGISLSVKSGECVVLTGLSGCGKTTVTRLVNGLAPSYYRDAHPSALSGGQKQRLAIACAIFSGRRILILMNPPADLTGRICV